MSEYFSQLGSWLLRPETIASAFWLAFWVFVGIAAGALIQYRLGKKAVEDQHRVAKKVLDTEIDLNAEETARLLNRLLYLRERISAGQIELGDIFISMGSFDYSALNPLIGSGHFHSMLDARDVRKYFEFMRFFNVGNAEIINSTLRTDHERGKSLDYIDFLERHIKSLVDGLRSVRAKGR